jgi:hypothetical protein
VPEAEVGTFIQLPGRKSEECRWHGEAEFFGGLQINNQLKNGRLLDRKIAGF